MKGTLLCLTPMPKTVGTQETEKVDASAHALAYLCLTCFMFAEHFTDAFILLLFFGLTSVVNIAMKLPFC